MTVLTYAAGPGWLNRFLDVPVTGPDRWWRRRLFPLLAAVLLIVITLITSTTIGPVVSGQKGWTLPEDVWGTMVAAQRIARLHLASLYTEPTGLISFPGTAVVMVPAALLADLLGWPIVKPDPNGPNPLVWLIACPYLIAVSAVALFAADALAEHLGASTRMRLALAIASANALWSVSAQWGHPEDALAVGLLMYAVLDLSRRRLGRAGWLVGAAVAVQPLVLLAVPFLLATLNRRQWIGFLLRAAIPAVVILGAAATANWEATHHAITNQPNWPAVDHQTPWTALAPSLDRGAVAAGPGRILSVLSACALALVAGRRLRALRAGTQAWSAATLREVLAWISLGLALRCLFESVMVPYYMWPALAVALVVATRSRRHLLRASVAAVLITFLSELKWHSAWGWWGMVIAGIALTLVFAVFPARSPAARTG